MLPFISFILLKNSFVHLQSKHLVIKIVLILNLTDLKLCDSSALIATNLPSANREYILAFSLWKNYSMGVWS